MDFVLEEMMLKKINEEVEKALKESKQREDKMKSELQRAWERFKVAEKADRRLRNEGKIFSPGNAAQFEGEGRESGEQCLGRNLKADRAADRTWVKADRVADRNRADRVDRADQKYKNTGGLMCSHCGEIGHSKQRCYEIIGYPDWWDFTKKPRKISENCRLI